MALEYEEKMHRRVTSLLRGARVAVAVDAAVPRKHRLRRETALRAIRNSVEEEAKHAEACAVRVGGNTQLWSLNFRVARSVARSVARRATPSESVESVGEVRFIFAVVIVALFIDCLGERVVNIVSRIHTK